MRAVHQAILNEVLKSPWPQALLDIGCGKGGFTQLLADTFPDTDIVAIDIVDSKQFSHRQDITFIKGSTEDLPFDSEAFDTVITALSLHHWQNKDKGICEAYRVLRKGGRLIIGDPLLEGWMSNKLLGRLAQVVDRGVFTDAQRLTGYLKMAGFESIEISLIPNSMNSLYLATATKT